MPQTTSPPPFIRWFEEISLNDISWVGGKNTALGELYRELAAEVYSSRVSILFPSFSTICYSLMFSFRLTSCVLYG
ncbi:MAG: hypothetical protein ETSY1_32285 [Candidatus Entotheonella factor]|uniref:Uncharacterized protein n=1 Tax=Entotheonella factor TaxID=1429438 RepID=W4LAC9_ENTF1|nr:MAG: hypothetical protein ETSY1_32285 [Candidatus Entotheonella factor]